MPAGFFRHGHRLDMDSLLNLFIGTALAQDAAAPTAQPSIFGSPMILMVVMLGVFYFLLIRPQQKKQKEHSAMVAALSVGSEIVTDGGVLGKITELGEQFVTLEVADGVNIKVQRHAIRTVLPKDTIKHA
jgi:preprotein translocase subunit YajC